MERELYAVCPRCGRRARIISHRWDWAQEQDYLGILCACGKSEVPYDEDRVRDVDLRSPYLPEEYFRILIPADWESRKITVGCCPMGSWVKF